MRLRLVKENTNFDFFKRWKLWVGMSALLMLLAIASTVTQGLNFGIDFKGGTTIRTESSQPVDVAAYRAAVEALNLGDVSITEVSDPTFRADQNVAQIRIQSQEGQEAISSDVMASLRDALRMNVPDIEFVAVESVGPKVSGELIQSAALAVLIAIAVVLIYIWLRFEWQFAVGAVGALVHDIVLTIGVFSALQIKFDLAIIAALLTIVGYSLNDTVVVFDRVRENLRRFKQMNLAQVLNLSINETL
ncbi:MAG: protein translocase subunit SecF, partial [Planktomarina sp.]